MFWLWLSRNYNSYANRRFIDMKIFNRFSYSNMNDYNIIIVNIGITLITWFNYIASFQMTIAKYVRRNIIIK